LGKSEEKVKTEEKRGKRREQGWGRRAGDEVPPLRCAMDGMVRSVPLRSG